MTRQSQQFFANCLGERAQFQTQAGPPCEWPASRACLEAPIEAGVGAALRVHAAASSRCTDWLFDLGLEWRWQRQVGPLAAVDSTHTHRDTAPGLRDPY